MADRPDDTGIHAEAASDERLDPEEDDGGHVHDGGADDDGLQAIYDDPGELVDEDLA